MKLNFVDKKAASTQRAKGTKGQRLLPKSLTLCVEKVFSACKIFAS
jgi:hypothetical protein